MKWKIVAGTQTTELCLFNPFPSSVTAYCLVSFTSQWLSLIFCDGASASQNSMGGRDLLNVFKLLTSQQSYSASLCWKWILKSYLALFFFFVATDTKVLKATARFPSLSSSEPSTSAISTVRCWGWNRSEPLIKNRGKQHLWKAKIYQTHRL